LAQRLVRSDAIAFIPTDLIWAVLEVAQSDWRSPMAKGPGRIPRAAGMFQPYLERAVSFLHASQQSLGIEGEVILPEIAAQLRSDYDAKAVFLVRRAPTADDVRDPRGPNPWLRDAAPDLVASVAAEVAAWSVQAELACADLRIPCFDVGLDFERAMADAANALKR
jgi:hypothetical protein